MAQLLHPDIPGSFQQGRQFAVRNRLADLDLGQATRQNYEANQVGNMLSSMGNVKPEGRENYLVKMASQGRQGMAAAGDVAKMFANMDANQKARAAAEIKAGIDILATARDPQSYAYARQQLIARNPSYADKFPPQYNPQFVEMKLNEGLQVADILGIGKSQLPANIQEFNYISEIIQNPDRYSPDVVKQARIKAGLSPRATGSADITIVDQDLTDKVAGSKSTIEGQVSGAKEKSKLEQQNIYRPKIESAITEAKVAAQARGETLSELQQARAALPGLKETIENLRELAPIATSTLGGKIFDMAVKEAGFGATKGSTARAKWIAIVDNQVLPLLKQTFGAAFTVQEGERLRATLGDPDSTPQEKMAQLDAFLANKYREIETRQRYLNGGQPQQGGGPTEISDDDLKKALGL